MTKVLVTGVNGFVGHHVANVLKERGVSMLGVGNQPTLENALTDVVGEYQVCDLVNPEDVAKIDLKDVDAVINLAGFAKVGDSKGQGELYNRVNVGVHTTLYQECLNQGVTPRIIAVSTGAVYDPNQPMPITEESLLIEDSKTNEYVVSKKLTEEAVRKFNEQGLKCIIARPFNHTGPGQLPGFLLPDLAEQIEAATKNNTPLMVGNLETKRDFTDVRDVARAYVELALCEYEKIKHDVYNICSGRSIPGTEILRLLMEACGAEGLETEVDPTKLRTNDVMDIYGSRERITNDIGWEPTIPIEKTISDFVNALKAA
jgi:GDP-4-dehydro-6-deoxy-D-mannose reductase